MKSIRYAGTPAMLAAAILMLSAFSQMAFSQATFQSAGSGPWNASATWTILSGSDADGIPDADDIVTIRNGDNITVSVSDAACSSLTAAAGSTITIASGGVLPAANSYALNSLSTTVFSAAGAQTVRAGVIYGNLTLAGSGIKTVAPIPSDTTFISTGTLTVTGSGVTFDVSTNILHIYFQGNVIVDPGCTLDASVGIVVVIFSGSQFVNNGTFLTSNTPGFGYTPSVTYVNTTVTSSSPLTYYDLIVNGTISAASNITVTRNLTIMPSGVFNAGNGLIHSVGGNWTNGGTFNYGTSTIQLQGPDAAVQIVGASSFYNLVLNNPKGAAFTGTVTIVNGGSLSLVSGSISTGSASLVINNTNPNALLLDTNRISGTVTRAIAAVSTSTYRFLGANGYVIPNGTGNPTSITLTEHPGTNPPNLSPTADTNAIAKRYITFTAVGQGAGFACTLRLPYLQNEVRQFEAFYALYGYGASGWANLGFSSRDSAANYVEQSGISGYSQFAFAEDGVPLPVQLSSFAASLLTHSSGVKLTWTTASETNDYGFFVEQSIGTLDDFEDLPGAFLPGHGTTTSGFSYSWTVDNLTPGIYYFRLRQVDLTGETHLSEPVRVEVKILTAVGRDQARATFALDQNYPNPFNPTTTVQFSVDKSAPTVLQVFNVLGQQVATLFTGEAQTGRLYTVVFDAGNMPNGTYFCRLTSGEHTTLRKMLLLK